MEEYKKKVSKEKGREKRNNIIINIIVGAMGALIAAFIFYYTYN